MTLRALSTSRIGRIYDVVRADDEHDVGLRELSVHLIHLEQLIVRHVRLGQQNVHVSGHAASDRVNCVFHIDATLLEIGRKLAHCVLRFGNGQSITGNDYDASRISKRDCSVFRRRLLD